MLKTMGAFSTAVLALSITGCSGTAQPEADLVRGWSIENIQETGIRGVSPELIEIDGVSTLFVTSLDPQRVWHGDGAGGFDPAPVDVPPGADFTVIDEGAQWRIYWADFIEMPQAGQPMSPDAKKQVVSATTTDFRSYSPFTPTGVMQTGEGRAWGVPDTVVGPDGTVHMYWVDEVEGEPREVLRHATSSNGIDFTVSPDPVMFGGYVDPYVLRADEGDWLMLLSTTTHPSELPQKLHLARSSDGVAWEVDATPLLTDPERNYLDPTAYPTGEGEWQIVFATSPKDSPLDPDLMMLVSGVLRDSSQ
jgi:hypothetical protein